MTGSLCFCVEAETPLAADLPYLEGGAGAYNICGDPRFATFQ